MKSLILAGALLAAPAAAQQQAAAPATADAAAATDFDPKRLALATVTAAHLLPEGSYARMMDGPMDDMMDQMYQSMFNLNVGEMLQGAFAEEIDPKVAKLSFRELMERCDPHFTERLAITDKLIWEMVTPVIVGVEPQARAALARAYARKLTAPQLADLNRFLETDSGRAYAAESFIVWMDPEIMAVMTDVMPQIMQAMPEFAAKIDAATAHLPPPPDEDDLQERIAKLDLD